MEAAALRVLATFGVEGPAWIAPDFDARSASAEGRELLLESARSCEAHDELEGLSAHLLAFARRP